eukprot:jgi/Botrbrau1/22175/Bobra.168_1s0007.1
MRNSSHLIRLRLLSMGDGGSPTPHVSSLNSPAKAVAIFREQLISGSPNIPTSVAGFMTLETHVSHEKVNNYINPAQWA